MVVRLSRRNVLFGFAGILAGAAGCAGDGHFTLLGYTTKPNYDTEYRTIYVPIVQNAVYQAGPFRGVEFDLTNTLVKEIESKTPYKVTSNVDTADTELLCRLVAVRKDLFNRHQLNEVRDATVVLQMEVVWRDMRTGRILSNKNTGRVITLGAVPLIDPTAPPLVEGPEQARPVLLLSTGRFIPELGESTTTAIQMAVKNMAVQVVSVMEKDWEVQK